MNNTFLKRMALGEIGLDGIDLEAYLFRHVKQDSIYKSSQVNLLANSSEDSEEATNLNDWLKNNIQSYLANLTVDNLFPLTNYNIEVNVNDNIAVIDLSEQSDDSDLITRYRKIIEAASNSTPEELNIANFQIIKLKFEEEIAYLGYYKGLQKSTTHRKIMTYSESDLRGIKKGIVNIGGDVAFILINNKIFIMNPRNFEFAFKYTDEINAKRDVALNRIVELPCFRDQEIKTIFLEKSGSHLYARSLAQIKTETFDYIEEYYNLRCSELAGIKENLENSTEEEASEIKNNFGILIDLLDLINFEDNNSIMLTQDSNVTPLLHLFQDKIMESFLSKRIKTALG